MQNNEKGMTNKDVKDLCQRIVFNRFQDAGGVVVNRVVQSLEEVGVSSFRSLLYSGGMEKK